MNEEILINRLWSIYNNPNLENKYYDNKKDERRDLVIKIKELQAIVKKK